MIFLRSLLILSSLFFVGCASMMSGQTQEITLTSNERDVEVYMNDEFMGNTPLTLSISRQDDVVVEFQKTGYQPVKVDLKTKINPNFYWNLPFTIVGTTGMSTDFGSGSIYEFNRSNILVKMKPAGQKSGEPTDFFESIAQVGFAEIKKEKARHIHGEWTRAAAAVNGSTLRQ